MQTIVAGLMALTAMGAGIVSNADSVTVVARGTIGYVVGMLLAGIWDDGHQPWRNSGRRGVRRL